VLGKKLKVGAKGKAKAMDKAPAETTTTTKAALHDSRSGQADVARGAIRTDSQNFPTSLSDTPPFAFFEVPNSPAPQAPPKSNAASRSLRVLGTADDSEERCQEEHDILVC